MIKPFKCLIIDDEPLAIDVIENYLQRFANIEKPGVLKMHLTLSGS